MRDRLISELEQRILQLKNEASISAASSIVSSMVSDAVFRSQQSALEVAQEGVRDADSLQAQLAEMAEHEWQICQSNAEIEKANVELRKRQRALEHELQQVQTLEITVRERTGPDFQN
jgi:cell shape-determining protein MreC